MCYTRGPASSVYLFSITKAEYNVYNKYNQNTNNETQQLNNKHNKQQNNTINNKIPKNIDITNIINSKHKS